MAVPTPSARSCAITTWLLSPGALWAGVAYAPMSSWEHLLGAGLLILVSLALAGVWMVVDMRRPDWSPEHVDARRWLRACRLQRVCYVLFATFVVAQQGACFQTVGATSDDVGSTLLGLLVIWVPVLFMRACERSLEGLVSDSAAWNAVRDALASSPSRFREHFGPVVQASPDLAVQVLRQAHPAQLAHLETSDLTPLLTSSAIEVRLAALTLCSTVGAAA